MPHAPDPLPDFWGSFWSKPMFCPHFRWKKTPKNRSFLGLFQKSTHFWPKIVKNDQKSIKKGPNKHSEQKINYDFLPDLGRKSILARKMTIFKNPLTAQWKKTPKSTKKHLFQQKCQKWLCQKKGAIFWDKK